MDILATKAAEWQGMQINAREQEQPRIVTLRGGDVNRRPIMVPSLYLIGVFLIEQEFLKQPGGRKDWENEVWRA
jgi:hypothetical protein